jgi:hypothetical protein
LNFEEPTIVDERYIEALPPAPHVDAEPSSPSKSMPETGDVCVAELRNPSFGLVHRNASEIRKRPLRAPRPALESWAAARSVKIARTLGLWAPSSPDGLRRRMRAILNVRRGHPYPGAPRPLDRHVGE